MHESKASTTQKIFSVGLAIILTIIGLIFAIKPVKSFYFLFIIAFFLFGVYELYRYAKVVPKNIWYLVGGIVNIVFAIMTIGNVANFLFVWDMMLFMIPIWGICLGISKILAGVHMCKMGLGGWAWPVGLGVLALLMGLVLLLFPGWGILTMFEITGILVGVLLLFFAINVLIDAFE